jgi:hypothetical protein
MKTITRRSAIAGIGTAAFALGYPGRSFAAKNYDVGVTDTEIKLGTTSPRSGFGLRCLWTGPNRLFRNGQRSRRDQWPQGQSDFTR